MMQFEEQFPSLKDKNHTVKQIVNQEITNIVGETCEGYDSDDPSIDWCKSKDFQKVEFVLCNLVKKHCLDKQKVSDAFCKIKEKLMIGYDCLWEIDKQWKELGLK